MEHEYYFEVRGYELDSLGHVNNSVYLCYLEAARWKFFKEKKWVEYSDENRLHLVVTETTIRYIKELKVFDKAVVKSRWEHDGEFMVAHQDIYLEGTNKKMVKSTIKLIFVSDDRIVHGLPDFIKNELDNKV